MRRSLAATTATALLLAACSGGPDGGPTGTPTPTPGESAAPTGAPGHTATEESAASPDPAVAEFTVTAHEAYDEGWAMAFLPGTAYLLISERVGALQLRDQATGEVREVSGYPEVHHAGQAGGHDVIPGPTFAEDGTIYLSWVRPAEGGSQGVVGRATLDVERAALTDLEVIWEQTPAAGDGHYSLRLLIQGEYLFVTSGDRQEFTPAQDMTVNLGKVLRLTLDGDPAPGNPWEADGGVVAEFWTMGHRNALGIAEDSLGAIWVSEMGPEGGDELNLITPGANYGWPEASNGSHYGGADIPDHTAGDGFHPPAAFWTPSISPGSLLIYQGDLFTGWRDSAILGGLSGQRIVRVELHDDGTATEAQQWDMGERIRAVDEAPDGSIWLMEDGGRLLELRPAG